MQNPASRQLWPEPELLRLPRGSKVKERARAKAQEIGRKYDRRSHLRLTLSKTRFHHARLR